MTARDGETGDRTGGWRAALIESPAASYLAAPLLEVGAGPPPVAKASQATIIAAHRLQDAADYRGTLQSWFDALAIGGHLVVIVRHAFLHERQLAAPSRWEPHARRLYTPGALMAEVEEALAPNSYRVRYLGDWDAGYDYALAAEQAPVGRSDVLLVLEKRAAPAWALDLPMPMPIQAPAPDYGFEPRRTRIEQASTRALRRILILKLDHFGDFIMSIGALEKARATFPDAEITLVVGSWNVALAEQLGLVDRVIAFDAFPRNSSEEEVDVPGRMALFRDLIVEDYDLAIDLRVDVDTRPLLRAAKAGLKAGIGTAAQFPFLDIFLPLDFNRNRPETAREYRYDHHRFPAQGPVERADHRLISHADRVERHCAIIWGPYDRLRPGRYFFEPHLELDGATDGMLMLDIGLDARRAGYTVVPSDARPIRIPFTVERADTAFEFRIWTVDGMPSIDFSFFGGRLVREGAGSTLHQSEYGALLVELVALRLARTGLLADWSGA